MVMWWRVDFLVSTLLEGDDRKPRSYKKKKKNTLNDLGWFSLRTADVFPVVASLPPKGREATTGNTSAVRRLWLVLLT